MLCVIQVFGGIAIWSVVQISVSVSTPPFLMKAAFGLVRAEEHDRRAQPIDLDAAEDRRAIFGVRLT